MPTDKAKLNLTTIGSTGLPVWHGRVYEDPLPELQNERGRKIFREMSEQDPVIGGTLLGIEMLARQVKWTIKPAEVPEETEAALAEAQAATDAQPDVFDPITGLPKAKEPVEPKKTTAEEVADFIDGALTDMQPSFGDTLSEILSMLVYGWSWLEIIYKRREGLQPGKATSSRFDDGKIGWAGWHGRAQDTLWRWHYEDENTAKGPIIAMEQQAPPHYRTEIIPRWKSLHFVTKNRKQNPEGVSILRNAYRAWYMKKNIEIIEGIGIERDLAGLPVLWAPVELLAEDADDADKALLKKLQDIVSSIKRDEQEGIIMPMAYDDEGKNPLYKLELLSTGGDRQFDTNAVINRYDERILMSMMADFMLLGHQGTGSYALSSTKMNMFSNALSAVLDVLVDEINTQAIPQLVRLNGWDLKYCPTLLHGKIEANDIKAVGEYLRQLNAAGMPLFPNKTLEIYLLESAGLPSDPGAGELPLPSPMPGLEDESLLNPAAKNPQAELMGAQGKLAKANAKASTDVTGKQAKTGKDGDLGDMPNPGRPPTRRPQKRFVPLAQRATRAAPQLRAAMEPEVYQDFMLRVLDAGQFSALSAEDQAVLRAAESGS